MRQPVSPHEGEGDPDETNPNKNGPLTSNSLRRTVHASAAEDRMLNTWRNRPPSRSVKQSQAILEQKESEREVGFSFVVRIKMAEV